MAFFSVALKETQTSRPAYAQGPESWWAAVISQTALGAGAREAGPSIYVTHLSAQYVHTYLPCSVRSRWIRRQCAYWKGRPEIVKAI